VETEIQEGNVQAAIRTLRPVPDLPGELETLFRAHHDRVFRTAHRITGSAADAEDVLQIGPPVKMFDIPASALQLDQPLRLGYIRWASDDRAVTYVDTRGGVSNIWSQPLDGRPPKQITDFKSDRIMFFDWSRDGKRLALARQRHQGCSSDQRFQVVYCVWAKAGGS
jgi:hypothetical protein